MASIASTPPPGEERLACIAMKTGVVTRRAPPPSAHNSYLTPDDRLFEESHVGTPEIIDSKWLLLVDGHVKRPFTLSLSQLRQLDSTSIISFHECFGSPLAPSKRNLWKVGNVEWTGVKLATILAMAEPLDSAQYVWSEGLDHGTFAGKPVDCYQKDLPMQKALSHEVILAFEMNGQPLRRERGGPVRLVVPGWFGTNSTKWLCRISLKPERAPSLFTTTYYNVKSEETGYWEPVWQVEPNSLLVRPEAGARLLGSDVTVSGWAWSHDGISRVELSSDGGNTWIEAELGSRKGFEWQWFSAALKLSRGTYILVAQATSLSGVRQPLGQARNSAHRVVIEVT